MPIPDVLRRLPAGFALPKAPPSVKWTAPDEGRQEEEIEFSWAGETARHVGTVVHRWLQRIAEDGLSGWDAKRVDLLRLNFVRELERRGVSRLHARDAGELVVTALKNTLADDRGRWMLGPRKEAKTEYRLRSARFGTYVVDRIFRDDAGHRWVIDWKTSRHQG